jgi:isoleucyl-tRNA synthetase
LKISKKEIRKPYQVLAECKGADLVGIKYEQLMPLVPLSCRKCFRVISGDFVTIEDGTGIVHTSPFGADDAK